MTSHSLSPTEQATPQIIDIPCPCKSGRHYRTCCQEAHQAHQQITTPEQLMRARYCAHVLGLTDFIIKTYHSSVRESLNAAEIRESTELNWIHLQVLSHKKHKEDATHECTGQVHFIASFIDNGQLFHLAENSRFIQEDGLWFYLDGEFSNDNDIKTLASLKSGKIARNDPCPCGSGKKAKKCCA